jgi:hypothetical protein
MSACLAYPVTSWTVVFVRVATLLGMFYSTVLVFTDVREPFLSETGREFDFSYLLSSVPPLPRAVAETGKMYLRVRELCQRYEEH